MMKHFASAVIAVMLAAGVHAAPQKPGEWVSLFEGKSISQHWRGFKEKGVPDSWKMEDGAITRVAAGPDLVSREQYANFEFEWEWRLPEGGNSGVMYRVSENAERTYHTGPEYQLLDNARHPDGKDPKTSTAADYALHAPTHDMSKPIGEWNQSRLVVNDAHVEHWLNGMKVVEFELWTPEWTALVKKSKFNEFKDWGMNKTGHLVLQQHDARVQYRNLRVRRLS
ncbi:MAG: DUF1080 domain-containing protein [Vicinamibacterales bacterium]